MAPVPDATFHFQVGARRGPARTGLITTPHGPIRTPAFIPVGTKATVKGVLPESATALGAQAVLANAYHLYLQPGADIVDAAGGLGAFMNWPGADLHRLRRLPGDEPGGGVQEGAGDGSRHSR